MLILVLLFSMGLPSQAEDVFIRFGNSSIHRKEMRAVGANRVTHRLTDLEESGAGEDHEFVLACFVGNPLQVCGLIGTAVKQENDLEQLTGRHEMKLKSCELVRDHAGAPGFLRVGIESQAEGRFRFPYLAPCRR